GGGGGGAGGGAPPAVTAELAVAETRAVQDVIPANGQIEPVQAIELRPDIEGRLVQILVTEGAAVAAGQPLFKVDDGELRAQVDRAEADRDLARQSLERTRDLLQQRAASQSDLERAEATARSTAAALELLRLRLARTVVRAPFTGVAGQRLVSLGDYVTTATRLVVLQTVDPQRAAFTVPERFASALQRGQEVQFTVAALQNRVFTGTVEFIDPRVQLPSRTITVKARVANPRRELQAGMFIEARLVTATRPEAIVVPEEAVLTISGTTSVYRVEGGVARRRPVSLGVRSPGFVEVVSGIDAGDRIVIGGLERLTDGAPVKARERPAVAAESTAQPAVADSASRPAAADTVARRTDSTARRPS
ncbi:MAG: efflux RND transporter periplasmic adaptor subunit, partial [Gemmatimonadales bacterium]|nr:efflux RND transporter periplasmic adaptor subunit [Gemmatimonadales bacterium]